MSEREMSEQDTQHSLGKLIDENAKRDAIHIAVAPGVAAEQLAPGEHVGILDDGTFGRSKSPIGIVDPFLTGRIFKGERFWMFLYPNTITSLRHQWTHPAFVFVEAKVDDKSASVKWLTEYASEFRLSYADLIAAGKRWIDSEEFETIGFDTPDIAYTQKEEMWRHFEIVTGIKVKDAIRESTFFSCAC